MKRYNAEGWDFDILEYTEGEYVTFDDHQQAITAAVAAERERCRKICHEIGQEYDYGKAESVYRAMWRIEKGDEE